MFPVQPQHVSAAVSSHAPVRRMDPNAQTKRTDELLLSGSRVG